MQHALRRLSLVLGMSAVATSAPAAARAQDAESLEAAVVDFYDKLRDDDPSYTDHLLPGSHQFPRTGLLLQPNPDLAEATASVREGLNYDLQLRHLSTQVFGSTGIATYYTVGPTTYADGAVVTGTYRGSIVAVWQQSRWRFAHLHLSELKSTP